MRRFRFKTEKELEESKEWAFSFGMPKGWSTDKDLLVKLGTEITDPYLITECILNNRIRISDHSDMITSYYVEIKEKMKRYRFKTKEEFGRDMPLGWVEQMLPNLGKELINITPDIEKVIINGGNFSYVGDSPEAYFYRYSDTVEIEEPKRIPKEVWGDIRIHSGITGVETQNGDKFYLAPNTGGFVNINLKNHTTSEYSDSVDIESGLRQCLGDVGKKVYQFNSMQELIKWATT